MILFVLCTYPRKIKKLKNDTEVDVRLYQKEKMLTDFMGKMKHSKILFAWIVFCRRYSNYLFVCLFLTKEPILFLPLA